MIPSTTLRDAKMRARAEPAICTDSRPYATAAILSSESGLPLNFIKPILMTSCANGRHAARLSLALRLRSGGVIFLEPGGFLQVLLPCGDPRMGMSSQLTK